MGDTIYVAREQLVSVRGLSGPTEATAPYILCRRYLCSKACRLAGFDVEARGVGSPWALHASGGAGNPGPEWCDDFYADGDQDHAEGEAKEAIQSSGDAPFHSRSPIAGAVCGGDS